MKMSHTWLASHTCAIAWYVKSRTGRPRGPGPASRYHSPAPKSAPANTTYAAIPPRIRTAGTSASAMGLEDRRRLVGDVERPALQPDEDPRHRERQRDVDDDQRRVADGDPAGPGD